MVMKWVISKTSTTYVLTSLYIQILLVFTTTLYEKIHYVLQVCVLERINIIKI